MIEAFNSLHYEVKKVFDILCEPVCNSNLGINGFKTDKDSSPHKSVHRGYY